MDFLGLLRNDLRKGRMETYLHLRHRSKFTNNRHANPRDIHSVTLAFAAVAGWILAGSMAPPSWSIPASAFLLALYLVRRADLIGAYLGKGTAFLAASLGTLFLLDLVRGLSVFLGATRAFRDKLRLFRSPSRFPVSASEEPAVLHHAS